jgi:hypothetical protein
MPGYDAATLAEKTGKSESLIYSRLSLLHLVPDVAEAFHAERITASMRTLSRVFRRTSSSKPSRHAGARIIRTKKPASSQPGTYQRGSRTTSIFRSARPRLTAKMPR